jgi:Protein of unknown function DUF2834
VRLPAHFAKLAVTGDGSEADASARSSVQKLYLVLAVVGFAIPVLLFPATVRHGNPLLMASPVETLELIFGNYASAAFAADLLWVFVVFCGWVVVESRNRTLEHAWAFVVLACLFGVSGPLPLFLYYRERRHSPSHGGSRGQD